MSTSSVPGVVTAGEFDIDYLVYAGVSRYEFDGAVRFQFPSLSMPK